MVAAALASKLNDYLRDLPRNSVHPIGVREVIDHYIIVVLSMLQRMDVLISCLYVTFIMDNVVIRRAVNR